AAAFAYAKPDHEPEASELTTIDELHAAKLALAEGVHGCCKHVAGLGDEFAFEVRVGEGLLALEAERADVAKVAGVVLLELGTAKNKPEDLRAALAKKKAHVSFEVRGDACVFAGSGSGAAGLRRALETVAAYLTDAAFMTAKPEEWKKLEAGIPDLD